LRKEFEESMGTETLSREPLSEIHSEILWTILEILPMGVLALDVEGRLLFSNPAAERILSKGEANEGELAQCTMIYGWYLPDETTLLSPDHLPLMRALRGEQVEEELFFVRSTNHPAGVWTRVSGRPVRDSDGEITGCACLP
jgi:PAS domain-containing protein